MCVFVLKKIRISASMQMLSWHKMLSMQQNRSDNLTSQRQLSQLQFLIVFSAIKQLSDSLRWNKSNGKFTFESCIFLRDKVIQMLADKWHWKMHYSPSRRPPMWINPYFQHRLSLYDLVGYIIVGFFLFAQGLFEVGQEDYF